jgi:hypothetical protein
MPRAAAPPSIAFPIVSVLRCQVPPAGLFDKLPSTTHFQSPELSGGAV